MNALLFSRNEEEKLVVLLIEQMKNWYNFPKGHLDEGEDEVAAALRETFEETGVRVRLEDTAIDEPFLAKYSGVCKLHSSLWEKHPNFPDSSKRPLVIGHKSITFFSAFVPDMPYCYPQDGEALSVGWFTIEEANTLIDEIISPRWNQALLTSFVQKLLSN
jgi:8-oxo-dGTP pyrophosphatase MutT (NUDIX family)